MYVGTLDGSWPSTAAAAGGLGSAGRRSGAVRWLLVYHGAASALYVLGSYFPMLRKVDTAAMNARAKKTGKPVWSYELDKSTLGPPISSWLKESSGSRSPRHVA